ncbi:MAG: ATP-binding cassette domain-containing protein [Caldilineaceae bacterium]
MSEKIIFSLVGVNKTYPPNVQVIKDISLSFFYGAKIGVLGLNGAGKSTLLRIIAGEEQRLQRRAYHRRRLHHRLPGAGAHLDAKTVREVVEKACRRWWTPC